ncbi:MAG: Na(+)-translocating NADH-quinone reductase subunit A [Chitinophagales bacterium]
MIFKPSITEVVKKTSLSNAPYFKLRKGYDIKIEGSPVKETFTYQATTCAVNPKDIHGISPIPKVIVEVGDEVKAGDVIFFDKKNPSVKYVAPVSGEIVAINRGEKRSIAEIVILADKEINYKQFETGNLTSLTREEIIAQMLEAGLWPLLKQRPFNEIALADEMPKGIFISAFNSHPMAANLNYTLQGTDADFQAGINALSKLTKGAVHLSLDATETPASAFVNAKNVSHYWFNGKHPAGNVGIQIHHIDPILKGDIVWTIGAEDVVTLGKYFNKGIYDPVRTVALGGPQVKKPGYYKTRQGANVSGLLENNLKNNHVRVISGNVLTGQQIDAEKGHLGFYSNQLSVIEEGDDYEMFGWLIPSYMRPSISKSLPAALFPNYKHNVNTNTHGEHRAFVVTGQYESVLPMNLYPQHLLKAIIVNDLDKMEGLGIYEVVEEDLALCEFVCTSKQHVQEILREGLEYVKEQG